jgi:hypothetical protein
MSFNQLTLKKETLTLRYNKKFGLKIQAYTDGETDSEKKLRMAKQALVLA